MTLVSLGVGAHRCCEAADELARNDVGATVIDLRTVTPLDGDTIRREMERTGAVVVVDEDYIHGGLSGEVAAVLAEAGRSVPFGRVAVETTIPYAPRLKREVIPNVDRIVAAVDKLAGG